ncbi:hypothetical protein V6B08_02260 [Ferrovibrio sp. MS7]|uniref:hypothetical protein n=1 Tax=Ferrovibrio plantarum TaxID=3119164 RepID=UPI00313531D7
MPSTLANARAALFLLLLVAMPAAAKEKATSDHIGTGPAAYDPNPLAVTGFAGPDQWIIPRYFERLREDQIRAKASRKNMARELPPGLSKLPAKGDVLPLNFERRPLPSALRRDLPKLPAGLERVVIAQDVALVRSDGLVLDIISGVVR